MDLGTDNPGASERGVTTAPDSVESVEEDGVESMLMPSARDKTNAGVRPISYDSPVRLLLIVVVSVFLAEAIIMTAISFLHPVSQTITALLDSLALVVLVFPALYWFFLRPLQIHIADRKKVEADLALRESLFRKVLETLPVGVWILNAEGRIAMANPVSRRIWSGVNSDRTEGPGQYAAWRLRNGEPINAREWLSERALMGGEASDAEEIEVETLNGERKTILVSSSPLTAGPRRIGAIVVTEDITERKRAEREIRQSNSELAVLYEASNQLFAAEQKARRTAEVLREAGVALTHSLDMATVMEAVLDSMMRLVPYDSASIMLVEDSEHLSLHAARGCDCVESLKRGEHLNFVRDPESLLEQVISEKRGMIVEDVSACSWSLSPCGSGVRGWLGVPFIAGENVLGLCGLGKAQVRFYTLEHLEMAQALAGQAAVAVQNAWLFAQLRSSRERLQSLSRQLVELQEKERGYVARELHDEAGQVLTSLKVGLRLVERDADQPEAVVKGIAGLKAMVDGVLENLHRLAMDLRPASLDYLGLDAALRQHMEAVAEQNQVAVEIETVGLDVRLPRDVEIALYRIVQEALANVVRHSQATRVDVVLNREADRVIAVIEDNGVGFDERAALRSGRLGLFGMRERAEMLGGSLTVESGMEAGTTLWVEVPYADPNRDRR